MKTTTVLEWWYNKSIETQTKESKMIKDMTTEDIASELWDLYKYAYGARPRHITEAEWKDREFLENLYQQCIDALDE